MRGSLKISKTAVIAGTGLYEGLDDYERVGNVHSDDVSFVPKNVDLLSYTHPFPSSAKVSGRVDYILLNLRGALVCVFLRHGLKGSDHVTPAEICPPTLLFRRAKQLGIERMVASSAVGSQTYAVGDLVTVRDFFLGTSFFPISEGMSTYVPMIPAVDETLTHRLHELAQRCNISLKDRAGYMQFLRGRRFETDLELAIFESIFEGARKKASHVDNLVYGMTAADEAPVAKAYGIRYACVAIVVDSAKTITTMTTSGRQKDLSKLLLETAVAMG